MALIKYSNYVSFNYLIAITNKSLTLTVVLQCIPRLAEVKRLPQDFLLVYVCWEKTGHFLYWPVKFGRGLQVTHIEQKTFVQPTFEQRYRQNSVFDLEGSWPRRFHGLKRLTHSFARLGLEDRRARYQGFMEVVVVVGTFKGVSDWRPTWSLWSNLWCYRLSHFTWRQIT